ncbi:MAG TPA: bifunctional UDP-N-acetylglucosamine diphosphorylase/glucosamine-1-phosphate N-acetyltransferase GlmU [Thermoanaerobaculia bacterium]|nr:bifunctional UDP-N-acetylglucosamine diphosphorylase/glucosamine-1-phosphate N-acetyltransferase GlmU [Thermoanaerobaculia bacterium]
MSRLEVVILAAGLGTRMKSSRVKVLHRAGGRPLIRWVLDLAAAVGGERPVIVVGHQRGEVGAECDGLAELVVQEPQLGTGHAVLQAERTLRARGLAGARVLVLSGDVPLTRPETLRALVETHERERNAATVLTMRLPDPGLYGRIVRGGDGSVERIVEAKDTNERERAIDEVNAGIYVFDAELLFEALHALSDDNAQGEYYLTDVVAGAASRRRRVGAMVAADPIEALGVNSRADLGMVEAEMNRRAVARLMDAGVTFRNPQTVSIDSSVSIGPDTTIYPFVVLEGSTTIGRDSVIEPSVHLVNVKVGDGVHVRTGTVAENAEIADGATVGPYAHLRPGTKLGRNTKVGNFVETKNAVFGEGSKASHLSYIGDAEIGAGVNVGAGTITCNFDGVRKHKTVLEDGVFIGSDTQLVAPVTVGRGAYVGAGSTVTKNVPPDALALSRTPQKNIEGWAKKKREERDQGGKP